MPKIKMLNHRQDAVVLLLDKTKDPMAVSDIITYLEQNDQAASRMTINRDLRELINRGYLKKSGSGRGVTYRLTDNFAAAKPVNVEAYFKVDPEKRSVKKNFNFDVFSLLDSIFTTTEARRLEELNQKYQQNVKKLSPTELRREYERLTIELSWKSSHLEGNTYTLLETDYLLKEHKEPAGHTKEEATMILNHKVALDYIRAHSKNYKKTDVRKIEEIHTLLIKDSGVAKNIRTGLVRVTGTDYRPLDNKFQIREALEKTCTLINNEPSGFAKALAALLLIAYIQPFEDGNKRTSRLIGNAILIAHDICPLSFRSLNELEYKKSVLLFYEQNNFSYFKELFIVQFEFAVNNYFG